MADNFKPGDVVQLISGGPLMTVRTVYNNGNLDCVWFDKDGLFKDRDFVKETVKKVDVDNAQAF